MAQIISWINGISWSLAYIIAIIIGLKRRAYCIPGLAICMNFSWELLVVLYRLLHSGAFGRGFIIQTMWLLLDVPILISWFVYSRRSRSVLVNSLLLLSVMGLTYLTAYCAGYWEYSVFLINVFMSMSFIYRSTKDPSPWTSCSIAILKLIGTLAATVGNGVLIRNPIILWLGGLCLLLDIYYLILLLRKRKGKEYETS